MLRPHAKLFFNLRFVVGDLAHGVDHADVARIINELGQILIAGRDNNFFVRQRAC